MHVRHVEEDGRGGAGGAGGHRPTLRVEKVDAGDENCCSSRCTWPGFSTVATALYVFLNAIRFSPIDGTPAPCPPRPTKRAPE